MRLQCLRIPDALSRGSLFNDKVFHPVRIINVIILIDKACIDPVEGICKIQSFFKSERKAGGGETVTVHGFFGKDRHGDQPVIVRIPRCRI